MPQKIFSPEELEDLSAENPDLHEKITALIKQCDEAEATKEEALKQNADLENLMAQATQAPQVAAENKNEWKDASFTYDGKTKGFAFAACKFNGKKLTPADVIADPELQRQLIEKGSGWIIDKP